MLSEPFVLSHQCSTGHTGSAKTNLAQTILAKSLCLTKVDIIDQTDIEGGVKQCFPSHVYLDQSRFSWQTAGMPILKEGPMGREDFYQEVEHIPVSWREQRLHVPLFYQDFMYISATILVPREKIQSILPSERLKPYRITPSQSAVSLTAYQYRECDIGPYNELSVNIPVTLDNETPLFTGTLRKMPADPMGFCYHLPVTTEIARIVGVEFAGYPKFVAEIEFEDNQDWISCVVRTDDQHILTLRGRKLELRECPRVRFHPLTFRSGYLLRSEMILNESEMGSSKNGGDVSLELGQHPVANDLRDLGLGKIADYHYCPKAQGILTQVIESFSC